MSMAGLASMSRSVTASKTRPTASKSSSSDQVDEELAYAGHVRRARPRQGGAALLGEHRLDAAAVGEAGVAGDQARRPPSG